jgi:phage FluMu gp28-like protein
MGYGGTCYAGLDIGRTSDRTELIIVNKDDVGVRWKMYSEGCKRTSWDDIERLAAVAFSPRWDCARLCVDATGMGVFPAERLQQRFGRHRVEPVVFTAQAKEDLATSLYTAFVEQTVRIDRDDTLLRDDLCAIRRIITTAGNVRYDAPHTDEGHADKAWALALALHGCNAPPNYRHVSPGR